MSKIAIAQLCRSGDLACCALMVAKHWHDEGNEVVIVVSPQHASLLDGCSYCKPIILDTDVRDVVGAVRKAKDIGYEKIIATQVDGNQQPPQYHSDNFVCEAWVRAGMLHKFHDLPLIFDRRDAESDEWHRKAHLPPTDGRPLLGYNFQSVSSPYERSAAQIRWIKNEFGEQYRLLDLGGICCRHILGLLPLIESCRCLISVDTLTMHLSYATGTPLIGYSIGEPNEERNGKPAEYYNSEPRQNWVYRCSYGHSVTPQGRAEVSRILKTQDFAPGRLVREVTPLCVTLDDKVIHVVDWWDGDKYDAMRINAARRTYERTANIDTNYRLVKHEIKDGQRSSADLGDTRQLPYVQDIIRRGCDESGDDDIVCFTNGDVCLTTDAIGMVRQYLHNKLCCFSRRVDCDDKYAAKDRLSGELKKQAHVGSDLFAARKRWWLEHLENLPDVFMACEGFDWCLRHYFWRFNRNAEIKPPVLLHVAHRPYWALTQVIHDNVGQRRNREACRKWAIDNGMEAALNAGSGLFKLDEWWMGK